MPLPTQRAIPSREKIEAVSEFDVLDENGRAVTFGSLFEKKKTVAIFIRHFWCATCQSYVMQLASIPNKKFEDANLRLVVIGCGSWDVIPSYREVTGFKGEVYTDPSRSTFRTLDLVCGFQGLSLTPRGQKKKSYITKVTNNTAWYAFRNLIRLFIKNPRFVGRVGNFAQLGGDFVFGPGPKCTFASRMRHTEDHIEVSELIQHLGIEARPPSPARTMTALSVDERSRRDCSQLLPDELVVVPSQLGADPRLTPTRSLL